MRSALMRRASLPNLFPVAGELIRAEGAALVVVADRIGCTLGLRGQGGVAKVLRLAGRAVAKGVGAGIVPPGTLIERGAVEDFILEVGMFEADADELHKVLGAEPDRQTAVVEGLIA